MNTKCPPSNRTLRNQLSRTVNELYELKSGRSGEEEEEEEENEAINLFNLIGRVVLVEVMCTITNSSSTRSAPMTCDGAQPASQASHRSLKLAVALEAS